MNHEFEMERLRQGFSPHSTTTPDRVNVTPSDLPLFSSSSTTQLAATENEGETFTINFVNRNYDDIRQASICIGNDQPVHPSTFLYNAMKMQSVKERGIFIKVDSNKDFSINVVIKNDDKSESQIRYSVDSTRTVSIESLLRIPYVQNTHPGVVNIEVKEVAPVPNFEDDDL